MKENECPVCGRDSPKYEEVYSVDGSTWEEWSCTECMSTWDRVFEFSHIEITFNTTEEIKDIFND